MVEPKRSVERLPVNPRRHKVAPAERKRVARACNSCNVRRVKCSGGQPCQQCLSKARECHYPAAESGGVQSMKEELNDLRRRCIVLEKCLQQVVPDDTARRELIQRLGGEDFETQARSMYANSEDTEATEGRLLFDPDGNVRFLGESSGATFLDYLKHFMLTLVPLSFVPNSGGATFVASIGRYQTADSRPFPDVNVDPLWLPTRTEMTVMLAELRYHVQDGNGDFPSGGIYFWGDLSSVPGIVGAGPYDQGSLDAHRYLAFHHMCFALASRIVLRTPAYSGQYQGDAYFKRARMLLGNPLDTARYTLSDVPVLSLMGFYLIEMNRRDAAYIHVTLAIHIAVVHGVFRHCEDEASKRIFWTLYVLDRWLSCLMGRPPTVSDEAIRLPLPTDAPGLPPCYGLLAHVQLAQISGYIVGETYSVTLRNPKPVTSTQSIDSALAKLHAWFDNLPVCLQLTPGQTSHDIAACYLHMAYYQLVLLTTRPIYFAAVKRAVAERIFNKSTPLEEHPHFRYLQACQDAARKNLQIAHSLAGRHHSSSHGPEHLQTGDQQDQTYGYQSNYVNHQPADLEPNPSGSVPGITSGSSKLLLAGLHSVFNATVILLLDRVLRTAPDAGEDGINLGIRLFELESRIETYGQDCYQVLVDLRAIVDRFLSSERTEAFQQHYERAQDSPSASSAVHPDYGIPLEASQDPHLYIHNFDDVYGELMTWMQNDDQLFSNISV